MASNNKGSSEEAKSMIKDENEFESSNSFRNEEQYSTCNIYKNLLLICFAFTLNFTSFGGVSNLQSSLNYENGLGTGCLAVIYAALILSAMFTPTIIIRKCGCKWTICLSIVGYVFYTFANFYPTWYTMIPASIMVGLSAAPLWAAKCTYLTTLAHKYSSISRQTTDTVVNRFFGIFFLFFQLNSIFGSLISSFVISAADTEALKFPTCYNETYIEEYCGANDAQKNLSAARILYNSTECPVSDLQSGDLPKNTLYMLMGIFAGVGLFGALIVGCFVDNIDTEIVSTNEKKAQKPTDLLVATFKQMKDKRQLLLIPITMYSGFEQAFIWGDYTRSYVTCPLAVNWVGFVLICFGTFDSICSFLFGRIQKYTGVTSLFLMASLINATLAVVMLMWIPNPSSIFPFFAIPAGWGVADAVWQTQLNAYYGVLFLHNKEAAFSNYRLWESLGFVVAFAYQSFVVVQIKLYVLLGLLPLGMILLCYIQVTEKKKENWNRGGEKLKGPHSYSSSQDLKVESCL